MGKIQGGEPGPHIAHYGGLSAVLSASEGDTGAAEAYRRDKLSNEFGQVVRRSGLPHNRFHDLRHAAATNMHQLTGDYYTVSEILGHTLEGTAKSLGFTT